MKLTVATSTSFHLSRLASELSILGHDVDYFTYAPSFRSWKMPIPRRQRTSLFFQTLPDSALAQMRGNPRRMAAVERMFARADDEICRRLRASDAFIGLSAVTVNAARRARDLGSLVVMERASQHVLAQNEILRAAGAPLLSDLYIHRELDSYEAADLIVVPSTHAAQSFLTRGFRSEQIIVQPLGVDLKTFAPRPKSRRRKNSIIFVGNWSMRKGCDLLVSAVRMIPHATLTHIGSLGDTPFPDNDPQFQTRGHKSSTALRKLLCEYEVLVLPSREDGFGMVLLEALAAGLPVVASTTTGAPDIRGVLTEPAHVHLVHTGDVHDLARGLTSALSKAELGDESVATSCLTGTDTTYFSWTGYAARYESVLLKAMDRRRRNGC